MPFNSIPLTLYASTANGPTLASSNTATSLLAEGDKITLPATYLDAGSVLKVTAHGRISTVTTTPGTMTFDLRANTTGVIVATSAALQLNATAKTNVGWLLEWWLTCRVAGTAAQFMHQGYFQSEAIVGAGAPSANGNSVLLLQASTPAAGTAFDSLRNQPLDFFGKWSISNSSNSITVHSFMLQSLVND